MGRMPEPNETAGENKDGDRTIVDKLTTTNKQHSAEAAQPFRLVLHLPMELRGSEWREYGGNREGSGAIETVPILQMCSEGYLPAGV